MKKWFKVFVSVLFATCLCLTLAACGGMFTYGGSNGSGNGGSGSGGNNSQPKEESDGTFIYLGASVKAASTSISGNIVIPSSHNGSPIDTIPANAFKGCTGITSITVPKEITSIGAGAFSGCSVLRSITLPFVGGEKGNSLSASALFGYIFGTSSYQGGTEVGQRYRENGFGTSFYDEYYIPSTLRNVTITNETVISYGAFMNCSMLTEINLNDKVIQVGVSSFEGCNKIEEISLPSISMIPTSLFSGCTALTSFTINNSVDTIQANAFKGCHALSMINSDTAGTFIIPNTVTTIGAGAFNGCPMIKNITLPFIGSQRGNSLTADSCFGYIFGTGSYQGGTEITQHYRENGFGTSFYGEYYIPSALRNVTITNETVISYGAFQNCSFLDTLTINSGAQGSIGTDAFKNATQPTWN